MKNAVRLNQSSLLGGDPSGLPFWLNVTFVKQSKRLAITQLIFQNKTRVTRALIGSQPCRLDEAVQHRKRVKLLWVCAEARLFYKRNIKHLPCLHNHMQTLEWVREKVCVNPRRGGSGLYKLSRSPKLPLVFAMQTRRALYISWVTSQRRVREAQHIVALVFVLDHWGARVEIIALSFATNKRQTVRTNNKTDITFRSMRINLHINYSIWQSAIWKRDYFPLAQAFSESVFFNSARTTFISMDL